MRRLCNSRFALFIVTLALVFVLNSVVLACPNCKEAMEKQDPTHGGMVKGYFYSILFMMGTPYLVFGSFCGVMYYRVRRARLAGKPKRPLAGAAVVPSTIATADSVVRQREPAHAETPQPLEV
ncbi:MAG TPA: hypothetical protein VG056_04995 [Pirellulales bacterium]|jgi:hypothetical protein|nr:hypothetical protein [Pirellulales bacterium]